MIRFMEMLSFLFAWGYSFLFFWIIKTFLPLRGKWFIKVLAFLVCGYLADCIIYSNDLESLLGAMAFFLAYILVFYGGTLMEKVSVLLVFYPALIAINYLMTDIGGRLFFSVTRATYKETLQSPQLMLISTVIHTISLFLRLLFWTGAWLILRKFLSKITSRLNIRMWLIVDMLMLASFVAIFTIIYFMPEDTAIVYPICLASIFSSFGCMYLASYICESIQTAYHAQELEMQQGYYKDRIRDEERVRSIYHDMKNHLLLLQAQAGNGQEVQDSIQGLKEQIQEYENYHSTGNEFLDIIIRDKAKTAQEKKIDFNAVISLESGSFLEPLDISTIFGNALDNAIEASEKLPEDKRLITVKAERVRDMLLITIENNVLPGTAAKPETTKTDRFLHGFGLPNIKYAAGKYGGQCSIKSEDGKFTLKIIVPVP